MAKSTKSKTKDGAERVKTSLALPLGLWTEVRIEALRRGVDAQDLVAEALVAFLKKGGTK